MQYITFHLIYNIKSNALFNFSINDPYERDGLTLKPCGNRGGIDKRGTTKDKPIVTL